MEQMHKPSSDFQSISNYFYNIIRDSDSFIVILYSNEKNKNWKRREGLSYLQPKSTSLTNLSHILTGNTVPRPITESLVDYRGQSNT